MDINLNLMRVQNNRSTIDCLQGIMYKDLYINDIGIRILGIYYMDNGPHWCVNRHKHSFFEFHYVLKDNVFTKINNTEYQLNQGQYYIIPPGTVHSHRQEGENGHIGVALRWEFVGDKSENFKQYNSYFKREISSIYSAHAKPITDNGDVISRIADLFQSANNNHFELELQINFVQVIINLAHFVGNNSVNSYVQVNHKFLDNNIVKSAMKFIDENYEQDIDVNDVANAVHLSYSHLARLFRDYSKDSINSYINRVRLEKAQYYLKCTDEDINTIARKIGFNSETYFCNFFKKNTGLSARSYRRTKNYID